MTTTSESNEIAPRKAEADAGQRGEALVERLFESTIGALELFSVHIGRELGLYRTLARAGHNGLTAEELASQCGINLRYAQEWLEQQAVAGFLDSTDSGSVDSDATYCGATGSGATGSDATGPDGTGAQRRFRLPAEHADVLVDPESMLHVSPFADLVAGIGRVLHRLPAAFRSGEGIPFRDYGPALRRGQAGINRPMFVHELAGWFDALPDIAARLDGPDGSAEARIADVGCGEGWSTIALARRFPKARIDAYDSDPGSIEAAREHARADGLAAGRVNFHLQAGEGLLGRYDLVLIVEALHDFARPVEVLRTLKDALAGDGCLLVADERVAEQFVAPGDAVERMMFGWSVNHCLPAAMAEQPSAALGTALRPSTVHKLAAEAGFRASTELPIHNDFFRFYRLDP